MSRKKLKRFAEIRELENVVEYPQDMPGRWRSTLFGIEDGGTAKLTVELGCGKAEFSLEMARRYPDELFLAVDKKGERIWRGATTARDEGLHNILFARFDFMQLREYFAAGEVDAFWITFPDPFPRDGDAHRRPTHPRFLQWYKEMLSPAGLVHLKTDYTPLYEYTKEAAQQVGATVVEDIPDLYALSHIPAPLGVQTTYEKRHLADGRRISYLALG